MKYEFFRKSKRFTAFLISFSIFIATFSPLTSRKVEAQWVVYDPINTAVNLVTSFNTGIVAASYISKEYGVDSIAWIVVNLIIERIAASTVNWINDGFRGSPAYISNPGQYFGSIADGVAGQFIYNNPNLNFLCGPLSARVKLALTVNYLREDIQWQCTLTQIGRNMEDFLDNFENGGWENFFEISQRQQNNPIGAYIQAQQELEIQIGNKTVLKQQELNWGRGFMTFKRCKPGRTARVSPPGDESGLGAITGGFFDENGVPQDILPDDAPTAAGNEVCLEEETTTPGAVIESKLNSVLNIGNDKLSVADEFNEIVSALLNQLITQIVGGAGKGLRALSGRDSTDNNRPPFTSLLASSTSITDFFNRGTNTTTASMLLDSIQHVEGEQTPPNLVYPPGTNTNQTCNPGEPFCSQNNP